MGTLLAIALIHYFNAPSSNRLEVYVHNLKKELDEKQEKIKELQAELTDKKSEDELEIKALRKKIEDYGEEFIKLDNEKNDLKREIEELQKDLDPEKSSEIFIEYYKDSSSA